MKKKFIYLFTIISLFCFSMLETKSQNNSTVRFGIIADIQYGDCETNGSRYYRNSLYKLDECIKEFNKTELDFIVNLGDLVDRSPNDIDSVMQKLTLSNAPVYNLTGNHDYNEIENNQDLYRKFKMPSEYYSLILNDWRFIMLNTNEIASYANVKDNWKEKELKKQLENIKKKGKRNGQSYNGGISSFQLKWLEEELKEAEMKKQNVIVFTHHPLYPASIFTAFNDEEILEILTNYPCVKLILSGHHHTGASGSYKGIPCITTEGMIETENTNAYGIINIYKDKIVLSGKGRTKSYEFSLNN